MRGNEWRCELRRHGKLHKTSRRTFTGIRSKQGYGGQFIRTEKKKRLKKHRAPCGPK